MKNLNQQLLPARRPLEMPSAGQREGMRGQSPDRTRMTAAVWGALAPAAVSSRLEETGQDAASPGKTPWGTSVLLPDTMCIWHTSVRVTTWGDDSGSCAVILLCCFGCVRQEMRYTYLKDEGRVSQEKKQVLE